ncbi:hypothetical protein HanPI659440_Chr02g0049931 [Helianthus annuus]|uniref:Uncharacterized protein n=1 Tax=Helianthus annuus TaxID=4232 RepID=A0A9K3JNJ4_HELAN|nr:hypothetical protein HanXRQr2_Chr02g0066221 [Helianthus annuus]KAJ0618803.1 hypothetical protein HanHA89_Chr02g0057721 [Helianthus annuus]KAJ0805435.1 hypothetical protein HanPI659440_Chr02g0049931 [Helianthus annuus]KAJ0951845.1 hypothetical protein HanPSC8_Chr02g0065171 [Helianthus annuus]
MSEYDVVGVEESGGPMPPLKWEEGLFEQIVRGHQFFGEWDARYPVKGQTASDAPSGSVSLFADFFGDGHFRLTATHFFSALLTFYHFHVSQLSPLGMVRIRHFELCFRSQGLEPTVERFRAFNHLQVNLGFFLLTTRGSKRLLINPTKSYHDWKGKFFFIRREVITVTMEFCEFVPIPKKNLKIPKGVA